MSRLPPKIEQVIHGKLVEWYQIQPIFDEQWFRYELKMSHKTNKNDSPIWMDYFVSAYTKENDLKWRVLYASINFEPMLETDVQEVYPVDFFLKDAMIVIKHEHYTENDRIFYVMKDDGDIKLKSTY